MDRKLLDILVCPASRQPLALLDKAGLDALNRAITGGGVLRVDDGPQAEPLREALVTRDRKTVYRVDDGIPVLLVEEGIATSQVAGFARREAAMPGSVRSGFAEGSKHPPPADVIDADVARALSEDLGSGDVTAALLPDDRRHRLPAMQGGRRGVRPSLVRRLPSRARCRRVDRLARRGRRPCRRRHGAGDARRPYTRAGQRANGHR